MVAECHFGVRISYDRRAWRPALSCAGSATGSSKSANAKTLAPTIGNPKARYKYEILDRVDCGVMLVGPEVKSLREGRASIEEAY